MRLKTIHPFPARMASEIALETLRCLPPQSFVLDPMCGSGTVVRQALECGHNALGMDIDPLSILMARVWTIPMSPIIKQDFGTEIVREAETLTDDRIILPWIDNCQDTKKYIDFWFYPTQQDQIRALLSVCSRFQGQKSNLAKLALSRLIITKTRGASLAADVSHSRPHKVRIENEFNVFQEFEKSFARLHRILYKKPPPARGKIRCGNAQQLRGIRRDSVDAVITSPPYLSAIDYLRGHKLSLVWLGYSIPQLRKIRSISIGAPTKLQCQESDRVNEIIALSVHGQLSLSLERTVKRYSYDMLNCLRQTSRVLRPNGCAVYVISNSVLSGIEVNTTNIIKETASDAGLCLEEHYTRDIPKKHRYLPPPQTAAGQLAARMKTESVLRFQKNSD